MNPSPINPTPSAESRAHKYAEIAREIYKYLGGGMVQAGSVTFYQGDIQHVAKIITKSRGVQQEEKT